MPPTESAGPTPRKKALFLVISIFLAISTFFLLAEIAVRIRGMQPWEPQPLRVTVSPGDHFFTRHPSLGYTHLPGNFVVTLGDGYSFKISHDANGRRTTHPPDTAKDSRPDGEIWIFGCSITDGWGVNDEESYPWLLQEQFPKFEVVNFGVSGYGTVNSLIQFRDALKAKRPRVVVLAYANIHDVRNTFTRSRRKDVAHWNRLGMVSMPFARFGKDGTLHYGQIEIEYQGFPLARVLAFPHFLEFKYNQLEERMCRSHAVSEAIILDMASTAKAHSVDFVVAAIAEDSGMLSFTRAHGIPSVDISVDLKVPKNTNLPHDLHPSAIAHRKYAEKLGAFLKTELLR